jgi:hypothetical protein
MAKKQNKTTKVEEPVVVKEDVVTIDRSQDIKESYKELQNLKNIKPKSTNPEDGWVIKDRMYYLAGGKSPLSHIIKAADIFYFDEEKGYERELKYTRNQTTPFVDEMKGEHRLDHIIFRNGSLFVPRNKQVLQKLLSLYHPMKGKLYLEADPVKKAEDQIDIIQLELAAMNAAQTLDIDMAEAVMRVEIGSKVTQMSSKELKRDLLLYAKRNPKLFLELVNDDNVMLRNLGIRATEAGILKLSGDNRTFMWASNDRKLMNVPFDEHPYSALAAWFKTDEGMEIYSNIEKRLNS